MKESGKGKRKTGTGTPVEINLTAAKNSPELTFVLFS